MIQSFSDKDTEAFYSGARVAKFQAFQDQARRRLEYLDTTKSLEDLRDLPSNRLEALGGDRAGRFSIRINLQWRICFRWSDEGPQEVEIVDYH